MSLTNFIKKIIAKDRNERRFAQIADQEGLNFVLPKDIFEACENGQGSGWLLHQYVCLKMMEEQGMALRIANGFTIPSDFAVRLEPDAADLLELPPPFKGRFDSRVTGQTGQSAFSVQINPVLPTGERVPVYKLKGPCLQLSPQECFLLSAAEWQALKAVDEHQRLAPEEKTEHLNLDLVGKLQASQEHGMPIDLSHFNILKVSQPEKVGVTATEQPDGSLVLVPSFGTGAATDDIQSRLGQLNQANGLGTLRVRDQIIVLDETRLKATQEIISNRRIPKSQVQAFLKTPSAFLDASLVDLETGFSLRVKGATRFQFMQFGETDTSGIDWFFSSKSAEDAEELKAVIGSKEELEEFRKKVEIARQQGAEVVAFGGKLIDISFPEKIEKECAAIERTLNRFHPEEKRSLPTESDTEERSTVFLEEVEDLGPELLKKAESSSYPRAIDYSVFSRSPFPHQAQGIEWMMGLMHSSLQGESDDVQRIQGALLADDMGLGKTYMALVGIGEFYSHLRASSLTEKPVLVIAPLSLLENWEDEVAQTFAKSPFRDIVVLQAGRDLKRFKIAGAPPEIRQRLADEDVLPEDAIRYALKVGGAYGAERLDMPKRLVLSTYQTLRDYQFSLCRVDWSVVVFDEAQNIKNPNALQTRAAKGLKAYFKLLATGTPVENSLSDFWCLMDTAQPGLLGTWPDFREEYVKPINQAPPDETDNVRLDVGKKLRQDVGPFMLRRLKEDHIEGLPEKRVFTGVPNNGFGGWAFKPEIKSVMRGHQLSRYDEIIDGYSQQRMEGQGRGLALGSLMQLREVSLHPSLADVKKLVTSSKNEALQVLGQSAKLENVVSILEEIKSRREKVIIFAMTKKLQRALKVWLEQIFGIRIDIINGDTQAVASKGKSLTRKGIISEFEDASGFGIIIMSPIAAGVGLTIVGANNVIHLERHWNPAKESQATDRIYRIGQKKDVNIYLPALHHPKLSSFDVNLDRLLSKKINLKDAVVTPQIVTQEELEESLFSH
ncbi:MAG: DEAD/DEAH box helicase [Syntrophotaleaceae bacterium]